MTVLNTTETIKQPNGNTPVIEYKNINSANITEYDKAGKLIKARVQVNDETYLVCEYYKTYRTKKAKLYTNNELVAIYDYYKNREAKKVTEYENGEIVKTTNYDRNGIELPSL